MDGVYTMVSFGYCCNSKNWVILMVQLENPSGGLVFLFHVETYYALPPSFCLQPCKKETKTFFFFRNKHLYMINNNLIPLSVTFQYMHMSFYLRT